VLLLATVTVGATAQNVQEKQSGQSETITLQVVADIQSKFQTMMEKKQFRQGMNLVSTDPAGEKLWADLTKSKGGHSVYIDWIVTDKSDKKLQTSLVSITTGQPGTPLSEERWLVCTEPKGGKRVCRVVPCVPKFPLPPWL
jgi:hypothetical protein